MKINENMTVKELMDSFKKSTKGTLRVYTDSNKQLLVDPSQQIKTIRLNGDNYEKIGLIPISDTVGNFCKEMRLRFGLIVDVANWDNSEIVINNFPLDEMHYDWATSTRKDMLDYMVGEYWIDEEEKFKDIETPGTSSNYKCSLKISLHEDIDQVIEYPFDTKEEAEERLENFIEEKTSSLQSEFYTVSELPNGIKELHLKDSDWWYELCIDYI